MLSGQLLLKSFVYNLPVDYFPYLGQMVGTAVLEVEVVGVLPYVEGEQRTQPLTQRVAGVLLLCNDEFVGVVGRQPHPSRAEESGPFLYELLLECFKRAELTVDGAHQFACGNTLCIAGRAELGEVHVVVEYLAGIVEHSTVGRLYDFFE